MSALLCASILIRGLTPEERLEEQRRVKLNGEGGDGGGGGEGREARTARMLSALDAAEEDLRSEAVPIRARGVVTLTRYRTRYLNTSSTVVWGVWGVWGVCMLRSIFVLVQQRLDRNLLSTPSARLSLSSSHWFCACLQQFVFFWAGVRIIGGFVEFGGG